MATEKIAAEEGITKENIIRDFIKGICTSNGCQRRSSWAEFPVNPAQEPSLRQPGIWRAFPRKCPSPTLMPGTSWDWRCRLNEPFKSEPQQHGPRPLYIPLKCFHTLWEGKFHNQNNLCIRLYIFQSSSSNWVTSYMSHFYILESPWR